MESPRKQRKPRAPVRTYCQRKNRSNFGKACKTEEGCNASPYTYWREVDRSEHPYYNSKNVDAQGNLIPITSYGQCRKKPSTARRFVSRCGDFTKQGQAACNAGYDGRCKWKTFDPNTGGPVCRARPKALKDAVDQGYTRFYRPNPNFYNPFAEQAPAPRPRSSSRQ